MSAATSLERPFWKMITVQLVVFRRILERLRGPLPSGTSPLLPRFGPDVDRTAWDWVISQFPGYQDAGFVKVIKSVASKNAKILESRAGKHVPELKRVVREVKGTFDKVFEETAEAVEDFLAKCT